MFRDDYNNEIGQLLNDDKTYQLINDNKNHILQI